ncbi:anti-sigma B factor RsbW [Paenibacillus sp. CC-CFT747]|nr:anti-sigma B factor RsbW [Paenibacillus sp. CC-CFT747]
MQPFRKIVKLTIPARAEYIDIARLSLYGIANKMGFSYEDIEDMKVAVAEACNNSVLHAYPNRESGSIDLEFEMKDTELAITISDQGKSFDYEDQAKDLSAHHNKELEQISAGGLGIYLMQALMDKVEVVSGVGTRVVLTKYLTAVNPGA